MIFRFFFGDLLFLQKVNGVSSFYNFPRFCLTFHQNFQEKSKNPKIINKKIIKKSYIFRGQAFFPEIGNLISPRGIYDLFMFFFVIIL